MRESVQNWWAGLTQRERWLDSTGRIDPVRARLINVPLPDSGYRYGDIVLHDGASTGKRRFHQSIVPVFNAMQRMETSEFQTFAVFATCPQRAIWPSSQAAWAVRGAFAPARGKITSSRLAAIAPRGAST